MTSLTLHPEAGALVRLLDGALEDDERVFVTTHVRGCPTCVERTADLRVLSHGLSRVLARTDAVRGKGGRILSLPARARRAPRRSWLRAAMIVLALAAAALAAPPVRAWLVSGWTVLRAGRDAPAGAPPAAAEPNAISFPFTDTVFVLVIDTRQSAGTLTIGFTMRPGPVRAEATSGRPELMVVPEGLRIANDPADTGSYRVDVPSPVSVVRVRIAGMERLLRARSDEPVREVELSVPARE